MYGMDLSDMKMFVLVVDAGGYRSASLKNGLPASSLSDAVQRLESHTGVLLINRTTRSLKPTEAGYQLLNRLRPILYELGAAFESITNTTTSMSVLRLNVPGIVARHILPQIASTFLVTHPTVHMEVSVTEELVDILPANCDAGVRYSEHFGREVIAVPIGPTKQRLVGVAAPDYLIRHGAPTHPRDLHHHPCIRHMVSGRPRVVWELKRGNEAYRLDPNGRLARESVDVEIAGAIAGVGIVFTFAEAVTEALADGRLVRVLREWQEEFPGPKLYYDSRRPIPAALKELLDFIRPPC